jgi:hypothetical protein
MNKLHQYLAEEGCSDSQLCLAKKLLSEAQNEGNCKKSEVAINWIIQSAKYGHKEALNLLEICYAKHIGITERNKDIVLLCLTRNEIDIRSEVIANTILTRITSQKEVRITDKELVLRLKNFFNQDFNPQTSDENSFDESFLIDEKVLVTNVKRVLEHKNPSIDITEDLCDVNLFSYLLSLLRNGFVSINFSLFYGLFLVISLNILLNSIFYSPNVKILYQNLLSTKTLYLFLNVIEIYSSAKVIERVNEFNNYKLWSNIISLCDSKYSAVLTKFFNTSIVWILVFFISSFTEFNFNNIVNRETFESQIKYFSNLKLLMILFCFLTFIKQYPNRLQVFFIIIQIFIFVYFKDNIYSLYFSITIGLNFAMILVKQKLNWLSFNLIIIPYLFINSLLYSLSYDFKNLITIDYEINFKLIISLVSVIILMKITKKSELIIISVTSALFSANFFINFYNCETNDFKFYSNIALLAIVVIILKNIKKKQKIKTFLISVVMFVVFMEVLIHKERKIDVISRQSLSWNEFYDNCHDLNNITKQIECFDIVSNHKLQAVCTLKSVRIKKITNNMRIIFDFLSINTKGYFEILLSHIFETQIDLNAWNVYDFEIKLDMKYSNNEINVNFQQENKDFVRELKTGHIYNIHIIYNNIENNAILLQAKCTTCWDSIVWNYNHFSI